MNDETVLWLEGSEPDKQYNSVAYYRCVGVGEFIKKIQEKEKIVAVTFDGNNLGFVLDK